MSTPSKSKSATSLNALIITDTPAAKLSTQQNNFKKLVAQIEAAEINLQTLAALMTEYLLIFETKLTPLRAEYHQLNVEMVNFLDIELGKKGWSKKQDETMREIICGLAEAEFEGQHADAMEAMFDKHSAISAADLRAEAADEFEEDLSAIFGINMARQNQDGQPSTEQEIVEEALKAVAAKTENARNAALENENAENNKARKHKKAARLSKGEQQAIDTKTLIKDIYRKLSSAIHPDRECDPIERLRKTALMSEANGAYENGNLLKLLQLQQQFGKVDQNAVKLFADEKLVLINGQLTMQLRDLALERFQLEHTLRMAFDIESYGAITEKMLNKTLKDDAKELRDALVIMRRNVNVIRLGGDGLKRWLKEQRAMMAEDAYYY